MCLGSSNNGGVTTPLRKLAESSGPGTQHSPCGSCHHSRGHPETPSRGASRGASLLGTNDRALRGGGTWRQGGRRRGPSERRRWPGHTFHVQLDQADGTTALVLGSWVAGCHEDGTDSDKLRLHLRGRGGRRTLSDRRASQADGSASGPGADGGSERARGRPMSVGAVGARCGDESFAARDIYDAEGVKRPMFCTALAGRRRFQAI